MKKYLHKLVNKFLPNKLGEKMPSIITCCDTDRLESTGGIARFRSGKIYRASENQKGA